ncbi:MAG: helix-turn-helix domain-containing protein [Aeromicrobium erythreum]
MDEQMTLSGTPVATLLRRDRTALVDAVVAAITERVTLYGQLPAEVLDVDVRHVAHENLLTFEMGLLHGRGLAESALRNLARSAYRRADEGIPLQLVQEAYLVGSRTAWALVCRAAGPGDAGTVAVLAARLLDHLAEVLSAVSAAYLEELRSTVDQTQAARARLVHALLQGEDVADAARTAGVDLQDWCAVLVLGFDPTTDDDLEPVGRRVAERRRMRALRGVLSRQADDPLSRLDPRGGVVLLPQRAAGTPWTTPRLETLVEELQRAAGAALHASVAERTTSDVHHGAREARDVMEVALRAGRPPGLHRLDDVLLEYQLSRPGPGAEAMLARVSGLLEHPTLVRTLQAYLRAELSRTTAAARLHVHPNTVDYRLGRVRSVTGLDPSVASELTLLRVGLLLLPADDE